MKFRHLTNWQRESFSLNKEYNTDWSESNYWSQKQNNEDILRENSNQSIEILKGIEGILKIMGADLDISILFEGLQKVKYYSELLKEYIFEDIRLKEFSQVPSRKNCMFLIPNEVNIKSISKI